MNSKLALPVLALLALGAYFLWPGGDDSEPGAEPALSTPEQGQVEGLPYPPSEDLEFPATDAGAVADLEPEQQQMIDELQTEIKSLMADFETYRNDADRRNKIQSEIDGLLAEYNEIILPIALSKVKEGS